MADPAARAGGAVRADAVARRADLRDGRLLQRRPRRVGEAARADPGPGRSRLRPARASSRTPSCSPISTRPSPRACTTTGAPSTSPSWTTTCSRPARDLFAECPIPDGEVGVLHLGGALNEHAGDDGAVGNRDARFAVGVKGMWAPGEPDADAFRRWIGDAGSGSGPSRPAAPTSTSRPPTRTTRASGRPTARTTTASRGQAALRPGQPVPLEPQRRSLRRAAGYLIVIQVAPAGADAVSPLDLRGRLLIDLMPLRRISTAEIDIRT